MADLSVDYAGFHLKNPLICASGPPTDTVEGCKAAAEAGFGAVVLKSIMHREVGPLRYQHAVPRFKVLDRFRPYDPWDPKKGIDSMGVSTRGEGGSVWTENEYPRFISDVKRAVGSLVKVGASAVASARNPHSWNEYIEMFRKSNADFVELDFGYARFYKYPQDLFDIVRRAKNSLPIPLTVKIAPFLTDPSGIVNGFEEAGADGITISDSTYCLDFDINGPKLPFHNTWAPFPTGVSLPYINRCIAECRMTGLKTSVSASFGVWHWEDVIKCIMAGSDAVQICRRVMLRGYREATDWLNKIDRWLDANNYHAIRDLKGRILAEIVTDYARAIPREEPLERGGRPSLKAVWHEEKCRGCSDFCTRVCLYFALRASDKKIEVDESKCAGCGMCESVCPYRALILEPR